MDASLYVLRAGLPAHRLLVEIMKESKETEWISAEKPQIDDLYYRTHGEKFEIMGSINNLVIKSTYSADLDPKELLDSFIKNLITFSETD